MKIAKASSDVHQHAGDEDPEAHRQRLRRERPRVVRGVAILALELDEPAEGQPVERVHGLALRAQDLGPRREADPELEDAHVGEARGHEMAELVDDHEDAEDQDEQDDRDDRLREPRHAPAPTGPVAKAARTARSSSTSSFDVGCLVAIGAEPGHGGLQQRRDARERQRSVEEAGDRHLVGGDERRGRPRTLAPRLTGDAQRREPVLVRRAEVEPRDRHEVGGRGGRRVAARIRQGVLDRESHVRGTQLGLEGAVAEADGGVDDALRVDDDLDRVVADIVQPVRLDDLQALVRERRGVDGDLRAHRPGRMPERLLRGDGRERRRDSRRGTVRRTR